MMNLKSEDMEIDPSSVPVILKPLLNASSALISFMCPPLAIPFALLASVYGEVKEQGTKKILERLQVKYDELNSKNLISLDFLASDQYVRLMMDVLRKAYAFNTAQKREVVAEIYKKVLQDKIEYVDSDEQLFIGILEKINANEVVILIFMEKNEKDLKTIDSWENFYELYMGQNPKNLLDKYRFKYFASQLELMGLVSCSDLFGFDAHFQVLAMEESRPCSAGITPMGKKFIEYLGNRDFL